jgi:hypothetical protein
VSEELEQESLVAGVLEQGGELRGFGVAADLIQGQ